jgi:hypothetical protein
MRLRDYYNEAPTLVRAMELEFHCVNGLKDRQIFALSFGYVPSEEETSVRTYSSILYFYIQYLP